MASIKRLSLILLTSCAGGALSACDGAVSLASPGDGVIVVPAPAPAPAPVPTPTPTPTPTGGPAASCPSGTTNVGTIGNYRSCRLPSLITGNTSLAKVTGVAYEINGRVDVGIDIGGGGGAPGSQAAVLAIEPGVVLYANTTNADNDFLVVNRGSRLLADGTEVAPIIFTSQQNVAGTANDDSQGQWGGVILAGRAPVSNCNLVGATGGAANCENVVEGTGTALYGGNVASDNSGTIRYVQFRFSGTAIAPDVELQSLTLGGVGYGTTIDHIQTHNSSDDGIEIFGGSSNLKYVVITGADDDSFDTDVGWNGFAQFMIAIQKPTTTQSDNFMTEIDSNNAEDALPRQDYHLANFTWVQTTTGTTSAMRLRGGADAQIVNGIITTPGSCMTIVAGANAGGKTTIRPADSTRYGALGALQDFGPPQFNSMFFACANAQRYRETTVNGIVVTQAEQAAVVEVPGRNVTFGTAADALTGGYLPGAGAQAVTAFNAATLNPPAATGRVAFLVNTSYIGAVSPTAGDPNATWFRGWTCNSNRASFGATSASCASLPS